MKSGGTEKIIFHFHFPLNLEVPFDLYSERKKERERGGAEGGAGGSGLILLMLV